MTATEQQATPAPPPLFSRRVKIIAVVLAFALVAWLAVAWYGRSQVHVLVDAEPLTCQGTDVVLDASIGDDEVMMPYVVVSEQMRCVFRFRVENRGPLPARVHRVTMLWYGPDRGSDAEAVSLQPDEVEPRWQEHSYDGDAVFALEGPYRIRAGETSHFSVELVDRPPGCRGSTGMFSVPDSPVVTVRVLGFPGQRSLVGESFGLACVR